MTEKADKMRKVILLLVVMALTLALASGIAIAGDQLVLDQSQTEHNATEVIDSNRDLQHFTAEVNGKLKTVRLYIGCCDDTTKDLTAYLNVFVGTNQSYGFKRIAPSEFQNDGNLDWVDVTFDDGNEPIVEEGKQYVILLYTTNAIGHRVDGPNYLWGSYDNKDNEDIYPGGYLETCTTDGYFIWCKDSGDDAAFETYVIDPPNTSITSGPDDGSVTTETSATFEFSADPPEGATFECKLDSGEWEACTSLKTYGDPSQGDTPLSEGKHTFEVRAIGPPGEQEGPDLTPAVRSWTVDTTAPNTAILGSSPTLLADGSSITNSTSILFGYRALNPNGGLSQESGITFQCKLDDSAWSDCTTSTSPGTTNTYRSKDKLADGKHDFQVAAVDKAGNTDLTPASRTWTVDNEPPKTTATATTSDKNSYTSGELTNKDVTVTLSAKDNESGSGVDKIYYSTDGTNYNEYTAPLSFTSDGQTTVYFYTTDKLGNQESPAQTFTVKLDKTAPSADSTTPANNETGVSRAIKEVTATFSEPLDPDTVSTTTVELFSGNSKNPLKAQVSVSSDGKTVKLTPPEKLDAKTKYTAKILGKTSGVKDLAGNPLAEDYVWSFTTGSQ